MKKMFAVLAAVAIVLSGLLFWPARPVKGATADMNAAQKTVEDFAPWISAVIQQRWAVANSIFPLQRVALEDVQSAEAMQIFTRFTKLDDVQLSLIGEHVLGDHIGTLLFTAATDDGPVAFKVFYYRFGTEMRIGKVLVVAHWTEIETYSQSVELLPTPVTAMLQSKPR